jgi:hypothetical protein
MFVFFNNRLGLGISLLVSVAVTLMLFAACSGWHLGH